MFGWITLITFALVISGMLLPSSARIDTVKVEEMEVAAVLIAEEFGMAAGGFINFDVNMEEQPLDVSVSRCVPTSLDGMILPLPTSRCDFLVCSQSRLSYGRIGP